MYAVIETGGKQYRVQEGDVIDVERLPDLAEDQDEVVFDRVLMVSDDDDVRLGSPAIDGAAVRAVKLRERRGPKIMVFKMKRRKGYRRKTGHRQNLLQVRIENIDAGGEGDNDGA